jgi:hypothetical protein
MGLHGLHRLRPVTLAAREAGHRAAMHHPIAIAVIPVTELQQLIEQAVERAVQKTSSRTPPAAAVAAPVTASPERMDSKQAGAYLGLSPATLEVDRCRRRLRLPYLKVGKRVLYERAALDRWLAERRVDEP